MAPSGSSPSDDGTAPPRVFAPWPGSHRGAALGLPPDGPGSIGGLGRRFAGATLDALILLPFVIAGFMVHHTRWVTQVSATGVRTQHLLSNRVSVTAGLLLLLPAAIYQIGLIGWRGQTLAEQLLGLRVIRISDRQVPGPTAAMVRWLVAAASSIIVVFTAAYGGWLACYPLVVFGWAIWDRNRQGLHDRAARVIVVRTR